MITTLGKPMTVKEFGEMLLRRLDKVEKDKKVKDLSPAPKGKYSRKDSQRPGQALINYIRFVKGVKSQHWKIEDEHRSIVSHAIENYIWNMTEKEFEEALNFDWDKRRNEVKKEFRK